MSGDLANLTFSYIIQGLAVIIVLYEIWKKVKEIKDKSDEAHEWDMRVKKVVESVEKKEKLGTEVQTTVLGPQNWVTELTFLLSWFWRLDI